MNLSRITENMGRKLKRARVRRGMTQEDLAKALGLESKVSINGYEHGKTPLSVEYLALLPDILRCPVTDFLPDSVVMREDRSKVKDPDLNGIIERWPDLSYRGRLHVLGALEIALELSKKDGSF